MSRSALVNAGLGGCGGLSRSTFANHGAMGGGWKVVSASQVLTTVASDDFNRANADPAGGNWTTLSVAAYVDGGVGIYSNKVYGSSTGNNAAYWNANSFNDDQSSEAAIQQTNATVGVIVRASTAGAYIFYMTNSTEAKLFKLTSGGGYVQLGSTVTGVAWAASDVIQITAQGTTIKGFRNGSELISQTDSALTSGKPGLFTIASASTNQDNWVGKQWQ